MSQETDLIRYLGAGIREAMAQHATNRGRAFTGQLARRIIAECASELVEVEGRRAAYGAMMRASDRLVMGRLLEDDEIPLPLSEDEELLPGPAAVSARLEKKRDWRNDLFTGFASKHAAFLFGLISGLAVAAFAR